MFEIIAPNSSRDDLQTYRQGSGGCNAFAWSQGAHPGVASQGRWWAHKGSNLGPLPCEGRRGRQLTLAPQGFPRLPTNGWANIGPQYSLFVPMLFLLVWLHSYGAMDAEATGRVRSD